MEGSAISSRGHAAVAAVLASPGDLKQYGVKGMRWGHRKDAPSKTQVGVDGKGRIKKVVLSKGQREDAKPSDDAARAAIAKAKVRAKGGTDTLTNQELQSLVQRMNLEKQYASLQGQTKRKSAGQKFVTDVLTNVAKQQVSAQINTKVAEAIKKM